jgi:hypothetical protein
MRRFLTLVCLLCLAIPAGISISGCTRNPAGNYCNGLGYGMTDTDVASIILKPQTGGISLAFGQTKQASSPVAYTCKVQPANVLSFTYGTTNNQLVDISPTGNICAGTWNRNTGGGIANYTICSKPNPLPSTGGLPYAMAYITATAKSVVSNPVAVYVHAQVTSLTLVGPQQCLSQGTLWSQPLDVQACFAGSNNQQQLLCAPAGTTVPACSLPYVNGVSGAQVSLASIPSCTAAIGTLSYTGGISGVAEINPETNQITAEEPGTTAITASVAGSGSSAGYFSTCPPAKISVTLANGNTSGSVTQGVTQNLVTTVTDTNGETITGLSLAYQSTDPIDISAGSGGSITTSFPGVASVFAICEPPGCNPAPINQIGLNGTGLPISSNPVAITTPGTASDYIWFSAPGQSQYFAPVELLTGSVGSTVRLPYVPNSMVMDRLGTNLYFGSARGLMVYSTSGGTVPSPNASVPGVVLAVSPNNQAVLINDQVRQVFYLYNVQSDVASTSFGGMGTAASWTPDAQTLYITDSASMGAGHSDTLYVYSSNTGWSTYPLPCSVYNATSCPNPSTGAQSLAITIPSVGAYLSGSPTVAHTWCPAGTVGNSASITLYPQGDSVAAQTDILTATTDGKHILGAALSGNEIELSDIGVTIPPSSSSPNTEVSGACPAAIGGVLQPLTLTHTLNQVTIGNAQNALNATAVNQVVASPVSNLAFITYTGSTPGASLPYYVPGTSGAVGTVGYVTLGGSAASTITAPVAGAFSPDDKLFFVSTAGDNLVHYISVPTLTDTQQISPNLPACTPVSAGGNDAGCTLAVPTSNAVPATAVAVKPRATT